MEFEKKIKPENYEEIKPETLKKIKLENQEEIKPEN